MTGKDTTRLEVHQRRGWSLAKVWQTPTGEDALDLEGSVRAWWRERHAVPCERQEVPAGDGFTECVHVGRVDVPGTVAYIERLRADSR